MSETDLILLIIVESVAAFLGLSVASIVVDFIPVPEMFENNIFFTIIELVTANPLPRGFTSVLLGTAGALLTTNST